MGVRLEGVAQLRRALQELGKDCAQVQTQIVNDQANACLATAKQETPTDTGHLRRSWYVVSGQHNTRKARAETVNNVPYAIYVNSGHRRVDKAGQTVGWQPGKFMLEQGVKQAEKIADRRFAQLMEEVRRKRGL